MSSRYIDRSNTSSPYYSRNETRVDDKSTLEYISSLAIPPAWRDVRIAVNKNAKILAQGRDSNGKLQAIYHPRFRAKQDAAKFDRILKFASQLPTLRRQLKKDLTRKKFDKRKVLACAVTLLDQAYFRVGNDAYAKKNQSYGLTTLRSKHISIDGDRITFDFVGKSGQHHVKRFEDSQLAATIKTLDEMPGYELFRYYDDTHTLTTLTSSDVNDYIRSVMGEQYSAKDFRTWAGTMLACLALASIVRPKLSKERQSCIRESIKSVARRLGNTPAVAKSSYIDPRIIAAFNDGDTLSKAFEKAKKGLRSRSSSNEERCTVAVLKALT